MKLLIGLGNPGREHLRNRHNMGFLMVDAWVSAHRGEFNKEEFRSHIARVKMPGGEDVLVMKPLTYMNRSGDALAEAMSFFKIPLADIIVVHDELDIPPCSFRIKTNGGHGGHNGLRSILHLGDNFVRVRMGIGRPENAAFDIADYVLGNLSEEEWSYWEKNIPAVNEAIDMCVSGQVDTAMNKFNRQPKKIED